LLEPTGGNVEVIVDGQEVESGWGESGIEIARGEHTVVVHVRWIKGRRWGRAEARVVADDEPVTLDYMTPFFIWQKGRLTQRG
jgi:hypothetical protein